MNLSFKVAAHTHHSRNIENFYILVYHPNLLKLNNILPYNLSSTIKYADCPTLCKAKFFPDWTKGCHLGICR